MLSNYLRRGKLLAASITSVLAATAFQPAGCTINIDEGLLNQISSVVDQYSSMSPGHMPGSDDDHRAREGGGDCPWHAGNSGSQAQ